MRPLLLTVGKYKKAANRLIQLDGATFAQMSRTSMSAGQGSSSLKLYTEIELLMQLRFEPSNGLLLEG